MSLRQSVCRGAPISKNVAGFRLHLTTEKETTVGVCMHFKHPIKQPGTNCKLNERHQSLDGGGSATVGNHESSVSEFHCNGCVWTFQTWKDDKTWFHLYTWTLAGTRLTVMKGLLPELFHIRFTLYNTMLAKWIWECAPLVDGFMIH